MRVTLLLVFFVGALHADENKPNIIVIIADDLGWNDVSFHGSNQIPTPNIDALAYNGIILNRFYTQSMCTPSRASLLTGQHPIRYGFQGIPILSGEDQSLPLQLAILPEKLKHLGYNTSLIGKWHLGFPQIKNTPTHRGFDHHFGYWNGFISYFNHYNTETYSGFDMHDNLSPSWSTQHEYATRLFTGKARDVILGHDQNRPLFLMVTHLAVHTGSSAEPLEVPDIAENNAKFGYIADYNRQMFAGMLNELDESVGSIVGALAEKDILDDTIIMFLSDNGAPNGGAFDNHGSNWPLRGMKGSLFDGGVHCPAVVYYSKFQNKQTVNNQLIHISDLMPTLYAAAGGNVADLGKLDGINQWETLINGGVSSRTQMLLDIDDVYSASSFIGYGGRYKLLNGSLSDEDAIDGYFGEDETPDNNPAYDANLVLDSTTHIALNNDLTLDTILRMRREVTITCAHIDTSSNPCDKDHLCLFDLINDPCETQNLVKIYPDIVEHLAKELFKYRAYVQPQNAHEVDPLSNPIYYNNTWYTWKEVLVVTNIRNEQDQQC